MGGRIRSSLNCPLEGERAPFKVSLLTPSRSSSTRLIGGRNDFEISINLATDAGRTPAIWGGYWGAPARFVFSVSRSHCFLGGARHHHLGQPSRCVSIPFAGARMDRRARSPTRQPVDCDCPDTEPDRARRLVHIPSRTVVCIGE